MYEPTFFLEKSFFLVQRTSCHLRIEQKLDSSADLQIHRINYFFILYSFIFTLYNWIPTGKNIIFFSFSIEYFKERRPNTNIPKSVFNYITFYIFLHVISKVTGVYQSDIKAVYFFSLLHWTRGVTVYNRLQRKQFRLIQNEE